MLRAPPVPLGQRWLDWSVPLPPPFSLDLRLVGIQQRQQARIVGIVGVVDDRVLKVRRR